MALLNFPDPSVIQTYTANGNSWDWNGTSWVSANNLNLSDQVSGVLGTVYGGTGKNLSGMSVGSVIYADTSSSFAALAPGTNNYVLATQGNGFAPYWKIDDSGSGVWSGTAISLSNGGTNGTRSGIGVSYELAVYNAAGSAITQIETTTSIGNSVLLQTVQASFPIWVGQSSLVVGGATTAVCNPGDVWLIQSTGTAFLLNRLVGSNSVVYTSGTNTFTVPAGVYQVYAECWGGGGGATQATGAGAGGYAAGWINVTPAGTITATVGAGGTTSGTPGGDGGASTFSTFTANGGVGGSSGIAAGGTATGGTINITGGNGGSQSTNVYVSAFASGGAAPRGGLGFLGTNGGNGVVPGGGAGCGAAVASTFTGGRGQINVWWV